MSLEVVPVEEGARRDRALTTFFFRAREAASPEVGMEEAGDVRLHRHFVVAVRIGLAQAQSTVTFLEDREPANLAQSFGLTF